MFKNELVAKNFKRGGDDGSNESWYKNAESREPAQPSATVGVWSNADSYAYIYDG